MESFVITAANHAEKDGDRGKQEKYAKPFIDAAKDSIANIREDLIRRFSCEQRMRQFSCEHLKEPTHINHQ